jgi:FAD dependent oxidoreductase TIGR03364
MSNGLEVGIIGAGIMGLAHAYAAARRGHRVTVFERSPVAVGASIRNFGMIWPIGQPPGECRAIALRSRQIWLDVGTDSGVWVHPCGSIHLAHRDDEWAVLQEFATAGPTRGYDCQLLTPREVAERTDFANPDGLLGGLFSPSELCVNPRRAMRALPRWLHERFGVRFEFGVTITDVDSGWVRGADGRRWDFHRTIVCCGADFETLFPDLFASAGLKRCKLQMFRIGRPKEGRLGPHLASGLSLRHYANFGICPSLERLRLRIAVETPELDAFGIHVMAAQNDASEIVLGDSHEYDSDIEPFNKSRIDDLILRELRRVIRLPDWTVSERWHGIYAKHPSRPIFEATPLPEVHIRTGAGGSGMTMAFGLADSCWEQWS